VARSPLFRIVAIVFVITCILWRWDPTTGFTAVIRFAPHFADHQLPVLRTLPIATSPYGGYDGQYYAQIAIDLDVTSPKLVTALDKPSYRTRRILLPLLAHVLGVGSPWRVLQIYALLNLVMWVAFAIILWRLLPTIDVRTSISWFAIVLGVGALDSVRMALTDLPAVLFLVLAAHAVEVGRPTWAALCCLIAGFIREVSLLGALVVRSDPHETRDIPVPHGAHAGDSISPHQVTRSTGTPGVDQTTAAQARLQTFWLRAACIVPVLIWCGWLAMRLPGPVGHEGNFDWPGFAMLRQMWQNARTIAASGWLSQGSFGILGGLGLALQSIYMLRQWPSFASNPWVRVGLPFALLFWIIGPDPWIDYRAVARDCLPMTVAFNVLLARRPTAPPALRGAEKASATETVAFRAVDAMTGQDAWYLTNLALVVDGLMRMAPP